jgi:hypothetical protein
MAGSATAEYLARVLRGEPLVPLTHVSFAEEAGRGSPARAALDLPRIAPTRKRARAAAEVGAEG